MKGNLIVVGDYNRKDFLKTSQYLKEDFNVFFLEYLDQSEIKSQEYKKYGTAIFWKDYKSAYELIDKIKPLKVIFYFIESYNHIALNVACKSCSVPTYHLEHGIRSQEIKKYVSLDSKTSKRNIYLILSQYSIRKLLNKIKNRRFYFNTIKKSKSPFSDFLIEYYNIRSKNNIYNTFEKVRSNYRLADTYISFSPKIFEFHRKMDHLPDNYPVKYIGNPLFDEYASVKKKKLSGSGILLVDQPFHEQRLLGWEVGSKINFYKSLIELAKLLRRQLYIKPHPLNDAEVYNQLNLVSYFKLIDNSEFKEIIPKCEIVLGFASTLLLPLICLPYTICFCYENHPSPLPIEYSKFLTDTKAITKVTSFEELKDYIIRVNEFRTLQMPQKLRFQQEWLFKLDGKSMERFKEIVLDENP